jgi:hypothetical protein
MLPRTWVEQYNATLTPSPGYTKRELQRKLRHAVLDTLIAYHYAPTRDLESLSLESLCIEADSLKRGVPWGQGLQYISPTEHPSQRRKD